MVYIFLADGFEEIEALTAADILRRAGAQLQLVAVGRNKSVTGAHGIIVRADITEDSIGDEFEMMVLPGGMPGTKNLEKSRIVCSTLEKAAARGITIGAICAAPSILGHKGLLRGVHAVCYAGYEKELEGAVVENTQVCEDENIITGNGPGASFAFGFALAEKLFGPETAAKLKSGMAVK